MDTTTQIGEEPQHPIHGEKGKGEGPFTETFGRHVHDLLNEWHVPGVAIGVVDGDNIWTEGYGIATYPSTPVTPTTLFYAGSTSKAFLAAAFSLMISSGKYTTATNSSSSGRRPLSWKTPIAEIIPDDFVLPGGIPTTTTTTTGGGGEWGDDSTTSWATNHITIEDALSHRTGFAVHDMALAHHIPITATTGEKKRTSSVRDETRRLRYLTMNTEPRTTYQYCNQMYIALTHAAETLAGEGKKLVDILQEGIWKPLGMDGTYASLEDAIAAPEHLAAGYGWDRGKGEYDTVPFMPLDEAGGAGMVISNVVDYTKWIRMLLREDGPLTKQGLKDLKTPRIIMNPSQVVDVNSPLDFPRAYTLGWRMSSYKGYKFWTHSGGMNAYGAEVYFFPDLDFGVVTFANTAMSSNALGSILCWKLIDDKLGIKEEDRHNWGADWEGWAEKRDDRMAQSIDKYYPDRPNKPVPPSLPLEDYAGKYFHPGYLELKLELVTDSTKLTRENISLVGARLDASWPTINEFEHVSGEYWMNFYYLSTNPDGPLKEYAPAQFRIGPDGKVEALGITWIVSEDGFDNPIQGLIWFDKVG